MSYKRILVPVDGSSTSNAGLKEALKLAHARNAKLCLLHIMDEHMIFISPEAAPNMQVILDAMRSDGTRVLRRAAETARAGGVKAQTALMESRGLRVSDTIVSRGEALARGHHRDGHAWATRREPPDHGQRRGPRGPLCRASRCCSCTGARR